MKRKTLIAATVFAAAFGLGAVAAQNPMTQGYYFTDAGGNDATAGIVYTRVSDAATLQYTFTTSDTVEYSMDASNLYVSSNSILFEGSTADAFELTLSAADVTSDITITIPDMGAAAALVASTLTTNAPDIANSVWMTSNDITFEGATADAFEAILTVADVAQDTTFTFPDATSGSVTVGDFAVFHAFGGTAADHLDTIIFVADRAYTVTDIDAVWGVAESTGAMAIQVERLQGTEACGSGDDLLSATIDGTTTANTVNNGSLTATTANLNLAAGNRLCIDLTSTPNEIVNLVVTVGLVPN